MTPEEMMALIEGILANPEATPEEMAAVLAQVQEGLAALVSEPADATEEVADEALSAVDADTIAKIADGMKAIEGRINKAKQANQKKAADLLANIRHQVKNALPTDNGNRRPADMTIPAQAKRVKSRVYESNEAAYKVAQFFKAVNGDRKAEQWLAERGFEMKALTSANEASAGLLVPEEMDNAILKLRDEYGVARSLAQVVSINSDTWKTRKLVSGTTGYLISEGTAITTSDPSYQWLTLSPKLWGARTQYYQTLNDDSAIGIVDEITEEHGYAHAQKEDESYFNGDGTSTYGGIVGVTYKHRAILEAGGGTWTNDTHKGNLGGAVVAAGTTWASITDDNISQLISKVRTSTRNLRFTCSSQFYWEVLHILAMNAGGVTGSEVVNGVSRPVFYGFPVVFNEAMPKTTAIDQVPLLFGDFAQGSMMADRKGVTVETDKDITTQVTDVVTTTRWDVLVHDAGNYNATAADQTRGSIAALITQNS